MAASRILVVDDNHEVRRMITASIKTLSPELDVLDVPSAEEAMFLCSSLSLDLVVLDFRLPGMSGLDMVSRLRKRNPETKIILVTGVEDAEIRKQITQAGVTAYFFKPIEITAFLSEVKNCLWPVQTEPTRPIATPETKPVSVIETEPFRSTEPIQAPKGADKVETPKPTPEPETKPFSVSEAELLKSTETRPAARAVDKVEAPRPTPEPEKKPFSVTEIEPQKSTEPLPAPSATPRVEGRKSIKSFAFKPTLDERLTALWQQVGAESVLLVADSGQVVDLAGNPSPITSNPAVLPALLIAFKASQHVSTALGQAVAENLEYFSSGRIRIYLMPVDATHALVVVVEGYFEPEKLGMLDRAIHLAAHDLRSIIAGKQPEQGHIASKQEVVREKESPKPVSRVDVPKIESPRPVITEPVRKIESQKPVSPAVAQKSESPKQVSPVVAQKPESPKPVSPAVAQAPKGIKPVGLEAGQQIESSKPVSPESGQVEEVPLEALVDAETMAIIDELFSQSGKDITKEQADDFWENLEEEGSLDGMEGGESLRYDQARDLGLAPDADQKP